MPLLLKMYRQTSVFGYPLNLTFMPSDAPWIGSFDDLLHPFLTPRTSERKREDIIVRPISTHASWLLFQNRHRTWITNEASLINELEWRVFDTSVRHARNTLPIHAGAVVREDVAVLLIGASSSGKTTLTLALMAAGWLPLADDLCGLTVTPDGVQVEPCPRCCHLSPDSHALLTQRGVVFDGPTGGLVGYYRPTVWGQAAQIRRIIALRYVENSPLERSSLSQADGAALILGAAFAQAERPPRAAWNVASALARQASAESWHYSQLDDAFAAFKAIAREAKGDDGP